MSTKIYEVFVDDDGYTLYIAGMNWQRVFSTMKADTQLLIITLLLENEAGNHKVIKRDAKFFDDELKELEKKCTQEKIIQIVKRTGMDVYEYYAYLLPEKARLESLLPTAFTIRHKNLEQIINDHIEDGVLKQLYKIAKTKPQHILSIAGNDIVDVSERIIPDIEDHIYSELCKYSD
jgi:hypothetical protein